MVPHNIALLRQQLTEIASQLRAENTKFFSSWDIEVNFKVSCWVLRQIPHSESNHWNCLTKGLIIERTGHVWSFPFVRMHSVGEKQAPIRSFINCDLLEKLDGRLVCVCFPNRNPMWHTDQAIDCSLINPSDILNTVKHIKPNFTTFDHEYTFMFECIDKTLYLIGGRRLTDYFELQEEELDHIAKRLDVKRPRCWKCDGWQDVKKIIKENDIPNFIIRQGSNRIKLEKDTYIYRFAKPNESISYKKIIPLWVSGDYGDIEALHPESTKQFEILEAKLSHWTETLITCMLHWDQFRNEPRRSIIERVRSSTLPKAYHRFLIRLIPEPKELHRDIIREEIMKMPTSAIKKLFFLDDKKYRYTTPLQPKTYIGDI